MSMGRSDLTPRERRRQRTEQAILDAARQIISQEGIDALSIRAIADAIDYSPAGLYEYFGSKEEIVWAVCQEGFERFTHHLERVDTQLPAAEYMIELGLAYVRFATQNPDFFLLMFTTLPLLPTDEAQPQISTEEGKTNLSQQPSFAVLLRGIQRCVAEGLFQTRPGYGAFEMALTTWAHVHGVAMLRITSFRNMAYDFETVDRCGMQALFRGMCIE